MVRRITRVPSPTPAITIDVHFGKAQNTGQGWGCRDDFSTGRKHLLLPAFTFCAAGEGGLGVWGSQVARLPSSSRNGRGLWSAPEGVVKGPGPTTQNRVFACEP